MMTALGRFTIRDLNPWDCPALFALTGNPNVMRYIGFRTHKELWETAKLLETYRDGPTKWQAVCLDNDLLGVVGTEVRGHQAALTIMFRPDYKARGAGREFSVPFVRWIFTHPQIWRVWAYCHVDNLPVQRVLKRMGAVREGLLRRFEFFPNVSTEPQDCYVYAIVR